MINQFIILIVAMISKVRKYVYIQHQLLIVPQEKKRMAGEIPYKTSLVLH